MQIHGSHRLNNSETESIMCVTLATEFLEIQVAFPIVPDSTWNVDLQKESDLMACT